jgi:hypothetical protein
MGMMRKKKRKGAVSAATAVILGVGALALSACGSTDTVVKNVPGPVTTKIVTQTKTVTQVKDVDVPVPSKTAIKTVIKNVPGPTVTKVVDVPTPAPTEGTLLNFSGSGTEETSSFTVAGDGDYTVSWTFSGNTDPSFGGASNFIVQEDGGSDTNALDLPNVIASNGSGSTGVTDDAGTHTFDVQADGSWTIKVVSAP